MWDFQSKGCGKNTMKTLRRFIRTSSQKKKGHSHAIGKRWLNKKLITKWRLISCFISFFFFFQSSKRNPVIRLFPCFLALAWLEGSSVQVFSFPLLRNTRWWNKRNISYSMAEIMSKIEYFSSWIQQDTNRKFYQIPWHDMPLRPDKETTPQFPIPHSTLTVGESKRTRCSTTFHIGSTKPPTVSRTYFHLTLKVGTTKMMKTIWQ